MNDVPPITMLKSISEEDAAMQHATAAWAKLRKAREVEKSTEVEFDRCAERLAELGMAISLDTILRVQDPPIPPEEYSIKVG